MRALSMLRPPAVQAVTQAVKTIMAVLLILSLLPIGMLQAQAEPLAANDLEAASSAQAGQAEGLTAAPDAFAPVAAPMSDNAFAAEDASVSAPAPSTPAASEPAPPPGPTAAFEAPDAEPTPVESTDATAGVGRQLEIRGLTEEQLLSLGGQEQLEEKLIAFLELRQLSPVTVATAEAYDDVLSPLVTVMFVLDDASATRLALEYGGTGSYSFSLVKAADGDAAEGTTPAEGTAPAEDEDGAGDEAGAEDGQDAGDEVGAEDGQDAEDATTDAEDDVAASAPITFMPMQYSLLAAPPATITGRFTLDPSFSCNHIYQGSFPGYLHSFGNLVIHSFGNNNDGNNSRFSCISPSAANWGDPDNGNNRSGTVYATHWWDDHANGLSWYTVDEVIPDHQPAPPGVVAGVQYLGSGVISIKWTFDSWISIDKQVLGMEMVRGNPNYSLEGIVYDVFSNWGDASARTNAIGYVTLRETVYDGVPYAWGSLRVSRPGTYYVRERGGGAGFQIDDTIHAVRAGAPFDFHDGDTGVNVLKVTDKPIGDTVGMIVQKLDAETGEAWGRNDPQGLALAGAQFTVRYYNNYYSTAEQAEASGAPTRTWVVATQQNGVARLHDGFLVPGSDPLYADGFGNAIVPLGTVLIQETSPPPGYLLPSPNPAVLQQIRLEAGSGPVTHLNPVTVLEQPHVLRVEKRDINNGTSLPGAEFVLYKEGTPGAGDWTELLRFVTGTDGSFELSPITVGSYKLVETAAPAGYMLPAQVGQADAVLFTIDEATKTRLVQVDDYAKLRQELIKQDASTDVPLAGAEFALYSYPVAVADGLVQGDLVAITANDPAWSLVGTVVTDTDGRAAFPELPFGYYKLVETAAPAGYMLPAQAGQPEELFFIIDKNSGDEDIVAKDYAEAAIPVQKLDKDSKLPVPDTEFTLYRYPVEIENGVIIADTATIVADDTDWEEVAALVSDSLGRVYFENLPYGYYMLVESRPNPIYASHQESGGEPHFVKIDKYATGEVQVFEDMIIQISCEVYKKTIAVTSSGLDGTGQGAVNNVGHEEYLYRFGARSTSNVWADEFIVTDDLSYVTSLGYYMTTLWTGTSPAGMDFDNKMAVLYRTNMTAANEPVVFSYNPLAGNPENPNNPSRNIIYSNAPGWRIWAEQLPTTNQTRMEVSELGLAEGEYIIGLKVVYGGVVKDFFTGTGWLTEDDPHTVPPLEIRPMHTTSAESVLADWYYSVVASASLLPIDEMGDETVMRGSVSADINRNNGALDDHDEDRVETRVIEPFEIPTVSNGLVVPPVPTRQVSAPAPGRRLPQTGDSFMPLAVMVAAAALAGTSLLAVGFWRRRSKRKG